MHRITTPAVVRAVCCFVVAWFAAGWAQAAPSPGGVSLSWTSLGVPHIQAGDELGLGYGVGYAYARDNLCLLADEVLTVNGQRAQFLGREGQSSAGLDNLSSDIFFRWLNSDDQVQAFWRAQPAGMQQRISGYVAGFNRYIAQTPLNQQPEQCRNAGWLRPLVTQDVVRLTRRLLVEGGIGRFAKALVDAAPPVAGVSTAANQSAAQFQVQLQTFAQMRGSNAIAVGGARSENGKGLLLANPHFPWSGGLRFYQMHLTIPGQLDVMGAALPGLPLVNIGFNQHVAWTHTVDQSSHFTLHRLTLDAQDPLRYRVDGRSETLHKRHIAVQVREADGNLVTVEHDVYESSLGPLVSVPGLLPWDVHRAYALQDANLNNDRILAQWDAINRAHSVAQLQRAVEAHQGIPWVNTLAVDDSGAALYMNASVVPNVPLAQLAKCADPELVKAGLPGLDGSQSGCNWQNDPGAQQAGIVAARHLPQLLRNDVLQNSNDSAWMTQPTVPLTGFSPLISRSDRPLGLRARFALSQLQQGGNRPVSPAFLAGLVTGNHVYLANLVLDDILAFCKTRGDRAVQPACSALRDWDRQAQIDSGLGLVYFQLTMAALQAGGDSWRQPFAVSDPVHTPSGIAWDQPDIAQRLHKSLADAGAHVASLDLAPDTHWGQLQTVHRGAQRIAIPGGDGKLGVYNAITAQQDGERFDVGGGSSYIQLVRFDDRGPVAQGLLAMSQSSDPASRHSQDQTLLFSAQQWRPLPFTPEQIKADGEREVLQLQ
ncbi:MAG TPA: penicillin acylase family protein [Pseudomonas sp.]|uniref:bifunctional acylase PvdQ n=1 Tax=Pseudomonas sp. TaxID=306 RepID=UPI002ED93ECE